MNDLFDLLEFAAEIAGAAVSEANKETPSSQSFEEKVKDLYRSKNEPPEASSEQTKSIALPETFAILQDIEDRSEDDVRELINERKLRQLRAADSEQANIKEASRKKGASRAKVRQMIKHQEIMNKPLSIRD